MKTRIIKLKNFEGRYYTCSKCGHELKHAYRIDGGSDVYGAECIKHIAGWSKQVKEQNNRMKNIEEMLVPNGLWGNSFFKAMSDRNLTEDEMINFYLKEGNL
jgi:hypothetical protein